MRKLQKARFEALNVSKFRCWKVLWNRMRPFIHVRKALRIII